MKRTIALVGCIALGLAFAAARPEPGPALPYVQWAGARSAHEAGWYLARDEEAWQRLWDGHTGPREHVRHAVPMVDFQRCMVVAFFRGSVVNEDGEVVRSIEETADTVKVRFSRETFQTASFDGPDRGVSTTPFGIWVLPATKKAVVMEEGRASLKNEPLQWREVHRFDAR